MLISYFVMKKNFVEIYHLFWIFDMESPRKRVYNLPLETTTVQKYIVECLLVTSLHSIFHEDGFVPSGKWYTSVRKLQSSVWISKLLVA